MSVYVILFQSVSFRNIFLFQLRWFWILKASSGLQVKDLLKLVYKSLKLSRQKIHCRIIFVCENKNESKAFEVSTCYGLSKLRKTKRTHQFLSVDSFVVTGIWMKKLLWEVWVGYELKCGTQDKLKIGLTTDLKIHPGSTLSWWSYGEVSI